MDNDDRIEGAVRALNRAIARIRNAIQRLDEETLFNWDIDHAEWSIENARLLLLEAANYLNDLEDLED